jgi:hypothetical protein
LPAPRDCPTSVAAAFDIPHDGSSANMMTRIPMMLPATAALPKSETMRVSAIQLAIPTKT